METIIEKLGLPGRMISGSKSGYRERYPSNLAIFNANLCIESGKIWFGDLDLSLEKEKLVEISSEMGETVYVLYEMDGRFEHEDSPRLDRAVAKFFPDGSYELDEHVKKYFSI
jgi:hypothetical protein